MTTSTKNNEIRTAIKDFERAARLKHRLEANGIKAKHSRHLDKITNTRWIWGGHLAGGTCHYTSRWEISGNTFEFKDLFKKWGLKWDSAIKCWWIPTERVEWNALCGRIVRVGLKRGLIG